MHVKHLVHLSGPYFMKSEMVWPLGKVCVCVRKHVSTYMKEVGKNWNFSVTPSLCGSSHLFMWPWVNPLASLSLSFLTSGDMTSVK